MAPEKNTPPLVKTTHLVNMLQLINRTPGITKPEICAASGLMPSTVHGAVERLMADGLLVRTGSAASKGGRRAGQYRLAADIGCVGGVNVRLNHLEVSMFDLSLTPLAQATLPIAMAEQGPETYTGQIVRLLESCLAQTGLPREKLRGIGVTLPGPVDSRTGEALQLCGAPRWQHFPIGQRLREAMGCPVVVDKDVYAVLELFAQTGEVHAGSSCAYLSVCEGIGSALMINGQVYRGNHSLAGEIGHTTLRKDGIPCACGNIGCLELYCSDNGIVQQYNAQTGKKLKTVAEVISLAQASDAVATRVISQSIGYLVDTTASIIMTYDPQELLIFCTWLHDQRALYFLMLDTLYAKSIFTQKRAVQIRLMEATPPNLKAAAALAVRLALQEAVVSPS
jgi:predicted NBD/HSP70 family sugar kinase